MGTFSLTLPYPPTVNHYWRAFVPKGGGIGFAVGEAGVTFRKAVGQHVMLARTQARAEGTRFPLSGKLFLTAFVHPPDHRKRDLDNVLKALLDSLQHSGVIEDDSNIATLLVTRCGRIKGGRVHIMITEAI